MTLLAQTLAIVAAAGAVLLIAGTPWRNAWANVIALALAGLAVVNAALLVGEGQIALAWLAARFVTLSLLATANPQPSGQGDGPAGAPAHRLSFRPGPPDVRYPPERLSERVFRIAVVVVWFGIASVVALRASESGVVADPLQAWAALALLGGGLVSVVIALEPAQRSAALVLALSGLAIGLVWLDRDWGHALAIAVMEVIVALHAVADPGERAVG